VHRLPFSLSIGGGMNKPTAIPRLVPLSDGPSTTVEVGVRVHDLRAELVSTLFFYLGNYEKPRMSPRTHSSSAACREGLGEVQKLACLDFRIV